MPGSGGYVEAERAKRMNPFPHGSAADAQAGGQTIAGVKFAVSQFVQQAVVVDQAGRTGHCL